MLVPLQRVAHVRTGDKGDTSTIGVFAYSPELYPVLKAQLTAERVKAFLGGAAKGEVRRYEAANIDALNFHVFGTLGGGVSKTISLDTYGKAFSSVLLAFTLDVPDSLANHLVGG